MISYADRNLFYQDSVGKQMTVTFTGGSFTNADLIENDFTLEEMLNSEQDLCFGQCNSSCVTFTVGYYENSIVGKELTITTTPTGGTAFQIGKYTVVSDEANDDRNRRKIVAYDKLYDILRTNCISWYNSLLPDANTSKTLKQFRDSFFTYIGVEQTSQTLPNDSMVVRRTIEATTLTGKDILNKICEINGCFGKIGRDGNFRYVFLEEASSGLFPATTLYPSASLYPQRHGFSRLYDHTYIKLKYEDYEIQAITKLALQNARGENQIVIGSGTNVYFVKDNFLIFKKSNTDLTNIGNNMFAKISNRFYRPTKIEAVGDPCIETGDGMKLFTVDDIQVNTYVFKRTLKGIQSLKDAFVSEGLKTQANDPNTTSSQIAQIKDNIRRIEADYVKTTYLEANYITAGEISAEYATIGSLNAVSGRIDDLTAIAITTQNLSSQNISASQINAGTLDASVVSVTNLNATNITAGTLSASRLDIDGVVASFSGKALTASSITVGTASIKYGNTYLPLQINASTGNVYVTLP